MAVYFVVLLKNATIDDVVNQSINRSINRCLMVCVDDFSGLFYITMFCTKIYGK